MFFSSNKVIGILWGRRSLARKLNVGISFILFTLLLDTIRRARRRRLLPSSLFEKWLASIAYVFVSDDGIRVKFRYDDWSTVVEQFSEHTYTVYKPRKGWVVVDIGAHIGTFAIYAAKLVGNEGLVVCVEPEPENTRFLIDNMRMNSLDNLRIFMGGLWGSSGIAKLYQWSDSSTLSFSVVPRGKDLGRFVPLKTLDELASELSLSHVDIVKIDAEGAEMQVIGGGLQTLARTHYLVVELHRNVVYEPQVLAKLSELEFEVTKIERAETQYPIVYAQRAVDLRQNQQC